MASDELVFLQDWYVHQVNGDWEHQYGVEIGTLDNPGWRLEVDVTGTAAEGVTMDRVVVNRSDTDWLQSWCDGSKFHTACGPMNLAEAIAGFRKFLAGAGRSARLT